MGRTMKISKEDYLETILVCTKEYGACRVTDVAAHAKLVRTKTLAEGADYCDFRYSLKR